MNVLVTGGAGFLGSVLVDRLLAEGHTVDVLDDLSTGRLANLADARADRSARLKIHQVDVRGREVVELIERRAPEVIFHLALPTSSDATDLSALATTVHVLEGARRAGTRKVVLRLDADVYGEPDPGALPLKESHPAEPVTGHGVAGLAAVEYLRLYRERHGVDFTVLVPGVLYGPRQVEGPIASAARALLDAERPDAPAESVDLLYVDDVVDAFVRAADRAGGLLLNVGWGRDTPMADVLATMADAAGHPELAPAKVDVTFRLSLDGGRARIHLGWEPWTSIEEGIAQTLRWAASQRT